MDAQLGRCRFTLFPGIRTHIIDIRLGLISPEFALPGGTVFAGRRQAVADCALTSRSVS
jgi:hypothetical protein